MPVRSLFPVTVRYAREKVSATRIRMVSLKLDLICINSRLYILFEIIKVRDLMELREIKCIIVKDSYRR